jgi:hypothetical protein
LRPTSQSPCAAPRPHHLVHHFKQHYSFPRRDRARVLNLHPPREGRTERRQTPGACEAPGPAMTLQAGALARRPASPCDRGRAPLGAPSVAILGLGSAFPAPPFPAEHVQQAPCGTGRNARRSVSEPPGAAVTSRGRRTPLLAPPSGSSPETPLVSEDDYIHGTFHRKVQDINSR